MAGRSPLDASQQAARLLPRAFVLTVLAAVPLAAAVPLLPLVYGPAFTAAMVPAWLLLAGLVGEGVAGVVSGYLYGVGRPGANSLGVGVAVVVTVALDIALIPHYQAVGAAFASAAAYLTSSAALLACYFVVRRTAHGSGHQATAVGVS
jgi:O-antigen/teichoic acid export membrane protein